MKVLNNDSEGPASSKKYNEAALLDVYIEAQQGVFYSHRSQQTSSEYLLVNEIWIFLEQIQGSQRNELVASCCNLIMVCFCKNTEIYMHLSTDTDIQNMNCQQISNLFARIHQNVSNDANLAIYVIAPSSSSATDQLALVGDRLECLQELSQPTVARNGVEIHDQLRFFCGDKPAQQFERGTQLGGTYKCGGCGVKDVMTQNLAHTLQLSSNKYLTLPS